LVGLFLVKYLKENKIFYHTYQLKEERAYRIVIKYLLHSTEIEDIRQELFELGHNARSIINAQHRITKEPLNLFFVDLEPAEYNKDIFNITALQNKIIQIEPPRLKKKISYNARDANNMATQNPTVTNLSCVLNVVELAIAKNAKKAKKHQQHVHYAEAIILPTKRLRTLSQPN
jgi:hypothetical protein